MNILSPLGYLVMFLALMGGMIGFAALMARREGRAKAANEAESEAEG